MAKQSVNIGTSENKGDGDPLRTAFQKINENFDELYTGNFNAETDIKGSIFGDDSTLLVDGVNNSIPSSVIQGSEADNWTEAYSWGDHATAGYITTETDAVVGAVNGIVKADGAGNISAAVAGTDYLTSVAFSDLTSTPTTIAGYGITDAFDGDYNNLTSTPTTIAGYGITDAFDGDYNNLTNQPTVPTAINDLTDVDTATAAPYRNAQPLVWDTVDGNWYPGNSISIDGIARIETGGNLYFSANSSMVFQGTVVNGFVTTITASNPSQSNAIVFPNASGTLALTSDIPTAYTDSDVDTHLNTSSAGSNEVLSWDGADYAWVAQGGGTSSASNLIAWDLADTANSKVLDAGTVADSAWYYGDVVSDPANPATSIVLDISAATFTGNVMGEVHGDVKQADGLTLILDVDAGVGTAMYYGDVTGDIITESVQPDSSTTLDPGTVLTVKGGSTSAVNSVGGDLILDAGSGGAQGGVVKVGTVDGTGVTIGSGTGSIEMNSVTNFNANVDFESGSTVDFTGVTVTGLSGGGGSGLQSRSTATGTTTSLADAAEADLDITGFKSYVLLTITTDRAARVRLYVSDATRLADASRAEGVDPTADAGLIAEVITTGAETVIISPGAYGFNLESSPTTTIPCRVTNKSGGTATVQVTLNVLQLEA